MSIAAATSSTTVLSIAPTDVFNKKFILLVSFTAALGGLLFGFDTAIISGAIPYITSFFQLNEFSLGWAVSVILIGCGVGALFAGALAEKFGRRFVLIVCAVLFAISGIGAGTSSSLIVFIIFRLIGGLGVGAAAMVSPMYIAEIAPTAWRGRLVALYQLAIVAGILLAYLANYLLANIGDSNWRWMFASQTAPAAFFFIMLLFVPETPRWLVRKGKTETALKILNKTVGNASGIQALQEISTSFTNERTSELSTLFSTKYLPFIGIGIFIAAFQQFTGINSVIYYAPLIFKETGVSISNSLLQTVGIGVVCLLATFIAIGLVDKSGRKKLFLVGSVLMAVSLFALAACFYFQYFSHYVVLIALLVYVASFSATWGAVAWVYISEIFPNRIRGLALSVATLSLWIGDFIVTYTFPIIVRNLGAGGAFSIYAILCIIAFVFILIKVPETKDRSLEEIEKSLLKAFQAD
jgi:SP family arabinose:H+ symporter-like MFS transporter